MAIPIPKNAYGWAGGMPIISQAGASFRNKYGTGSVSFQKPAQAAQVPQIPPMQVGMPAPTFVAGMPMVGAGATPNNTAAQTQSAVNTAPMAAMPSDTSRGSYKQNAIYRQNGDYSRDITYEKPQSFMQQSLNNAAQRWARPQQDQPQAMRTMSPQRRYFNATGRIDARATPSANNYTPAPVTFKNSPSNWIPY